MAVKLLDHPCFVIRYADGARLGGEFEPHYGCRPDAEDDARERNSWEPGRPIRSEVIVQIGPCSVLICDDCGCEMEDAGEGYVMHLADPADAAEAVEAAEGSEDDGAHRCSTCTGDRFDCEDCGEPTRLADLVDDLCPSCRAKPDPNQLTIDPGVTA
jgi:hypothetical protein